MPRRDDLREERMQRRRADRIIDTAEQASETVYETAISGTERAAQIWRMILEEGQRTQRERADLARRWTDSPRDVFGMANDVVDMWSRRARRRLEVMRGMASQVSYAATETREAVQRVGTAGRVAVETGARASREAARRAGERIGEEVSERVATARAAVAEAAEEVGTRNGAYSPE